MSQNLVNQLSNLEALVKASPPIRKQMVGKGSRDFINAICECTDNALKRNIPINDEDLKKMHKYKHAMRKLVKKDTLKKKRKLLQQHGGFLQFLIPAAVSLVSGLISNAINK